MRNKKKILLNTLVSLGSQLIILVVGLIVPRLILKNYGSDVNGLTASITQIFTYLALLEAGISTASRNILYPAITNNDNQSASQILYLTRKQFRKISYIYFAAVVVLACVLPFILKTEVNYWTIFLIVLLEGATNVVSFYFVNHWTVYLNADGKTYVATSIDLATKILSFSVKIVLALFKVNIVFIQLGFFVASLIKMLIYWLYFKKKYSWIDLSKDKNTLIKLPHKSSFVIIEVAWTIFNSTDMIVLSIFISTTLASVYSIYNMVIVAIVGLVNALYNSLNYLLGQRFVSDIEEYKKVHDAFNSVFMSIITILMVTAMFLMIPFVELYTKNIADVEYIYEWLPVLFCLIPVLSFSRYVSGNLTGLAGYAKQVSIVSIIEASIKISLSIAFVFLLGIYGVLLATIVALPLKIIYCNWLTEKAILKRKPIKTIIIILVNYVLFGIAVIVYKFFLKLNIENYWAFALFGLLFVAINTVVIAGINLAINPQSLFLLSRRKEKKDA